MDLQLGGKTALVTGAWRGTGAVIAAALAEEGARVLVHGFEPGSADETVLSIRGSGGQATSVHGDLMSDEGAEQLKAMIDEEGSRIDILVNNFGRADPAKWSDDGTRDWLGALETNLLSAVRLAKLFAPAMKENGWGRIIQLGTIGSTRPNAQMPGYYAAKTALVAATVSLARELSHTGITVNHVSPGLIRTPEVEANFLRYAQKHGWGETWEEAEARITEKFMPNPSGRIATREDIADLVTFLASPRAGHINGQNIRCDGGAVSIVS